MASIKPQKSLVTGKVKIKLYDENGELKLIRDVNNVIVYDGLAFIASRMKNADNPVMSHIGVGSDPTPQEITDTQLGAMLGSLSPIETTEIVGDHDEKVEYYAVFRKGESTGAIVESAVFNPNNLMLCRTTFPVVNKQENDTVAVIWTISFANPEEE